MSYRKKIVVLFLINVLLIGLSIILAKPDVFGLCNDGDKKCVYFFIDYFDNIAQFIFTFSASFLIICSLLFFVKDLVFNVWEKFAKIFLPIAMILIIITPTQYGGIVGIDKESATWSLASLFLLASLTIIIWKSIELKKMK